MGISLADLTRQQQGLDGAAPDDQQPFDLSFLDDGAADAPPRAAAPRYPKLSLDLPLDDEEKADLGRRIGAEIEYWKQATQRRRDNLREWRRQWEVMPDPRDTAVWDNSADTPSPYTRIYCNSHHTRLNTQIISPKPPFTVVARKPDALDAAPLIEQALTSILEAADWAAKADELHQELVIAGNVFLSVTWKQEWLRRPQRLVETNDADAKALVRAGLPPHEAMWQSVQKLSFGHEDVLVYDGIDLKVIPFEDGFLAPANARSPEDAYGIGERLILRGADLKAGAARGLYDPEAVDELLDLTSQPIPDDRWERLDDQGLDLSGSAPTGAVDPLYREYLCYEVNWKGDWDGDGQEEWARVTLEYTSRKILRAQYLDYEHGRPCTMLFRYINRPGELLGMGIPELIATYVDADAATLCSLVNHADLVLALGLFFYDSRSGLKPQDFLARLGRPIKVEDTEGIKNISPPPLPSEHYTLRNIWKEICDLLTASSSPTLGRETGSDKTLGEIQIVQSQANTIFEDYAARVARNCWAKAWDHCRWLYAQYGAQASDGKGVQYRTTAAPDVTDFAAISPRMLTQDVDLVPAGLEQLADLATQIQTAALVRQTFIADPLVQGNWEAQKILDTEFLRKVRYPRAAQLIAAMQRQNDQNVQAALQQAQAAEAQSAAIEGELGSGPPGQPALPPGAEAPASGYPGTPPPPGGGHAVPPPGPLPTGIGPLPTPPKPGGSPTAGTPMQAATKEAIGGSA